MACPYSKADYSSENVSQVLGFVVPLTGNEAINSSARFPDCNRILDVPYTEGNLSTRCNQSAKISLEQKKYENYAKKSKRLKKFELDSPANITYFKPDICWKGEN